MMGSYGVFVLGATAWHLAAGTVPKAETMGIIGFLVLMAHGFVAVLLFAYRNGDSNMRSVWLCTRNDAIGNVAVMLAALGVFGSGAGWPDIRDKNPVTPGHLLLIPFRHVASYFETT
jgi:Co/Zn/Cd efflux system component